MKYFLLISFILLNALISNSQIVRKIENKVNLDNYGTPYLSFNNCGETLCPNILNKANLVIKCWVSNDTKHYDYGKNPFNVSIRIDPRLKYCNSGTVVPVVCNPGLLPVQNSIQFNLDQTNPEQVTKIDLASYLNPAQLQNTNCYIDFSAYNISLISGVNNQDVKIEFSLEEIQADKNIVISTIAMPTTASNQTKFSWRTSCPNEVYQLQVLRLYNVNNTLITPTNINFDVADVQWDKALSVIVKPNLGVNSYYEQLLTLAEGTGYYIWRVRAIKNQFPGGEANPQNWCDWNTIYALPTSGTVVLPLGTPHNSIFFYNQFDDDKNWIYSRNLIESEGIGASEVRYNIIGEGMVFANTLGMVKQSQSKSNENNVVSVSESFQDYVGRTVVQTLAAPNIGTASLGYVQNASGNFTTADFDDNITFKNASAFTSGFINSFYSDANSDLDIANADGFVYTRIKYTRDPLGKPKESSALGDVHAIKNIDRHTTSNMLGNASNNELVALFGDEAQKPSTVYKSISTDANNSMVLSYVDNSGKLLATAKTLTNSLYLNDLPSASQPVNVPIEFYLGNISAGSGSCVPVGVTQYSQATLSNDEFVSTVTIPIAGPVNLSLDYVFKADFIQDGCAEICQICDYEIEVTLANADAVDAYLWQTNYSINPSKNVCNDAITQNCTSMPLTPNMVLLPEAGEYVLTKKVKVRNTNPATEKKYIDEAVEILQGVLADKYWQTTNTTNLNWQVFDLLGNAIQTISGGTNSYINLTDLKDKLDNYHLKGNGNVYDMLGIDPDANGGIAAIYHRKLVLLDDNCNAEFEIKINVCEDCKFTYDGTGAGSNGESGSSGNYIGNLNLDDIEDYFTANATAFNSNVPVANQISTFLYDHTKLYNTLFSISLGADHINLDPIKFKTIIANMNTDPVYEWSCEELRVYLRVAISTYLQLLKSNAQNPTAVSAVTHPDLMDYFFQSAGYHIRGGTTYPGSTNLNPGYLSHPYLYFYYPQANVPTYVLSHYNNNTDPHCFSALSILFGNTMYNSVPTTTTPCIRVETALTPFTPQYFNPNFVATPPALPSPALVTAAPDCEVPESLLIGFHSSIKYTHDMVAAQNLMNNYVNFSSTYPNQDDCIAVANNTEMSCRKYCDGRFDEFKTAIVNSLGEGYPLPTSTTRFYNWQTVEGITSPKSSYSDEYSDFLSSNWLDVYTQQVVENCKAKCETTVVLVSPGNYKVGTYAESKAMEKVYNFEPKVYPNAGFSYFNNANAPYNNDGGDIYNTCNACLGFNGLPHTNCSSSGYVGNSGTFAVENMTNSTGTNTDPDYPLTLSGNFSGGCCPEKPSMYNNYDMESTDPGRSPSHARTLTMVKDNTFSSVDLMMKKITSEIAKQKTGILLPGTINIYPFVYNYLNPINQKDNATPHSTFLPDDNNGNDQLDADAGTIQTKNIDVNNNPYTVTIGLPQITTTTVGNYTITRKQTSVLALHHKMLVEVEIKPNTGYIPPNATLLEYTENLLNYGSGTTVSVGASTFNPPFKFVTENQMSTSGNLKISKMYNGLNSSAINFSYYVNIYDNIQDQTWAICNRVLKNAYVNPINTANPTSTALLPTANYAKLAYSNAQLKLNGGSIYTVNPSVDVPIFKAYGTNANGTNGAAGDFDPDIQILYDNLQIPTTVATFTGKYELNKTVQEIPLYYNYIDASNVPQNKLLWSLTNFKINRPNHFCLQWVPSEDPEFPPIVPKTCMQDAADQALESLYLGVNGAILNASDKLREQYEDKCVNQINDFLKASYDAGLHHITLYYYDRADNLVRTVQPKGVEESVPALPFPDRNTATNYTFKTMYEYNSLNQPTWKESPDGGATFYYYDSKGRIRFSQDAQQQLDGTFEYVKYDELGRTIEGGLLGGQTLANVEANLDLLTYPNTGCSQVTHTYYTDPYINPATTNPITYYGYEPQQYLLNRVSYTIADFDNDPTTIDDNTITIFSYDPHGAVKWMVQKVADLKYNYTKYTYDGISGAVRQVVYNEHDVDAFWHKYTYNSDKKLIAVQTSKEGTLWQYDAKYNYFLHGPLKNKTIGDDEIQRLDYAYTINGWLKGVNYLKQTKTYNPFDIADIYAYKLHYFENDFERHYAGSASVFNDADPSYVFDASSQPTLYDYNLFDGNINTIFTSINRPTNNTSYLYANVYKYDDINRLNTVTYNSLATGGSGYMGTGNEYHENFEYDANGNINFARRWGAFGAQDYDVDALYYTYTPNTNRLDNVVDEIVNGLPYNYDIKGDNNSQQAGNYVYDASGRLIEDDKNLNHLYAEGLEIQWDKNDRVTHIRKYNPNFNEELDVYYLYDAMGNRVRKTVRKPDASNPADIHEDIDYYIRDARGNIMATYKRTSLLQNNDPSISSTSISCYEQPIYGAERLGVHTRGIEVYSGMYQGITYTPPTNAQLIAMRLLASRQVNNIRYELTNHLGNVVATFSDLRITTILSTSPIVLSAPTYDQKSMYNTYAYGMPKYGEEQYYDATDQPACLASNPSIFVYRFGFNTQEYADELSGRANHTTALYWEYDTRLGRRWNLDPVDQISVSNYACFANNPIANNDVNGDVVNLIAGGIGALVGGGLSLASSLSKKGWDFSKLDKKDFAKAAVASAAGGLAGLTMGGSLAATVVVGGVTGAGQSVANDIIDKRPVSVKKALFCGVVGAISNGIGGALVKPSSVAVDKTIFGIATKGWLVKTPGGGLNTITGIVRAFGVGGTSGTFKWGIAKAFSSPRHDYGGTDGPGNIRHLQRCHKCTNKNLPNNKFLFKIGNIEFDW